MNNGKVFGVVLVDKQKGKTSREITSFMKKLYGACKAGHGGTLDPMATGLLLVALGEATKYLPFIACHEKSYQARIRFGITTTTHDAEGEIVSEKQVPQNLLSCLKKVLGEFIGNIYQKVPEFSAAKYQGKPLYFYARKGEIVPIKKRLISIQAIKVLKVGDNWVELNIDCGSGTYIRGLARDIGETLGCGGFLEKLERTRIGVLTVDSAVSCHELIQMDIAQRSQHLWSLDKFFQEFPRQIHDEEIVRRLLHGQKIQKISCLDAEEGLNALYDLSGNFCGVILNENNELKPVRMMTVKQESFK